MSEFVGKIRFMPSGCCMYQTKTFSNRTLAICHSYKEQIVRDKQISRTREGDSCLGFWQRRRH